MRRGGGGKPNVYKILTVIHLSPYLSLCRRLKFSVMLWKSDSVIEKTIKNH